MPEDESRTADFRTDDDIDDDLGRARATMQEGYVEQRVRHELRRRTQITWALVLYAVVRCFVSGQQAVRAYVRTVVET